MAREIYELYRMRYLTRCSIGFKPTAEIREDSNGIGHWDKSILIETSACNCGANPDARTDKGEKAEDITHSGILKKALGFEEKEEKAIGGKKTWALAPEERKWDNSAADKRIRKWAGDGKDEINWAKYQSCCIWYDPTDKENFKGYKLLFCDIIDGAPHAIWRAVAACMVILLGGRGGLKIPDGKSVV